MAVDGSDLDIRSNELHEPWNCGHEQRTARLSDWNQLQLRGWTTLKVKTGVPTYRYSDGPSHAPAFPAFPDSQLKVPRFPNSGLPSQLVCRAVYLQVLLSVTVRSAVRQSQPPKVPLYPYRN